MKCLYCKLEKNETDFYTSNHSRCKGCLKQAAKLWQKKNRAKWKVLHAKNNKKYRLTHCDKVREYYKAWYQRTHRYRPTKALNESAVDNSHTASI